MAQRQTPISRRELQAMQRSRQRIEAWGEAAELLRGSDLSLAEGLALLIRKEREQLQRLHRGEAAAQRLLPGPVAQAIASQEQQS
jgi:hypothetical protein